MSSIFQYSSVSQPLKEIYTCYALVHHAGGQEHQCHQLQHTLLPPIAY